MPLALTSILTLGVLLMSTASFGQAGGECIVSSFDFSSYQGCANSQQVNRFMRPINRFLNPQKAVKRFSTLNNFLRVIDFPSAHCPA